MYDKEKNKIKALLPCEFKGAFVAGGAVTSVFTNTDINDLDIYFKTEQAFKDGIRDAVENGGMFLVNLSKRAATFVCNGDIIQLCNVGFYPQASDIFESFDFTCCMGALDLDSSEFILHPDFLKHNSQRFLSFNHKTKYPIASMLRVLKYQQRGYSIGRGEMLKILLASRSVAITTWEEFADQVGGNYGHVVELDNQGKEFSIEAAIESLDSDLKYTKTDSGCPPYSFDDDYPDVILKALGYTTNEPLAQAA